MFYLGHDVVMCFGVFLCVSFCTGHFGMVPLNLTYLHCLQHSLFEHLFNLYHMICLTPPAEDLFTLNVWLF